MMILLINVDENSNQNNEISYSKKISTSFYQILCFKSENSILLVGEKSESMRICFLRVLYRRKLARELHGTKSINHFYHSKRIQIFSSILQASCLIGP